MQAFHFALNHGGFLFLGTSESTEGSNELFMPFDREAHIYMSRPVSTPLLKHDVPLAGGAVSVGVRAQAFSANAELRKRAEGAQEMRALDRLS